MHYLRSLTYSNGKVGREDGGDRRTARSKAATASARR
jgi:hypothetical protein